MSSIFIGFSILFIFNILYAKGLTRKELPKKIEEYEKALRKYGGVHNGKLMKQFRVLYDELHVAGYYRGLLRNANIVKDALKNAEDFIGRLKEFKGQSVTPARSFPLTTPCR